MAAKGISTGVERLAQQQKAGAAAVTQLSKQWKDMRNRIDVVLMSNNVMKSTEVRQKCLSLDQQSPEERANYITEQWGPLYLQRVGPLLQQLAVIEEQLARQS